MAHVTPAREGLDRSTGARGPLAALSAASALLLAVRLYAATRVGFGDSEALYASYALFPQAAYLDHPGLIGVVARAIGGGSAPSPRDAHLVTAVLSTLVPWLLALAARACGATWRRALVAGLALAAAPEIAVGLFGMTPDLPLAFAWIGALGLAGAGLRAPPASNRAAASLLFAGVLVGVACASKASGVLLLVALVAALLLPSARPHARTVWPWAGLAAGAFIVVPEVAYEIRHGAPMLRHRLIDTQAGAGISLRNVLAVALGQLAYVSPVLLFAAWLVARHLLRPRKGPGADPREAAGDPVEGLLLFAFALPLAALLAFSIWSPVAEPHWLAPPLLALAIHAARTRTPALLSRRLVGWSLATGFALSAAAHAWVLVPAAARLRPDSVDARADIANELFGWPRAIDAVREIVDFARLEDPRTVPVVIGPSWTICAQLRAALDSDIDVGCAGPIRDDFDDWFPRAEWQKSERLLLVTDERYPVDVAARFPDRFAVRAWEVPFARGGRLVRTFRLTLLAPRAPA